MLKILILGATGMLGSTLLRFFLTFNNYRVLGTVRNEAVKQYLPREAASSIISGIDCRNTESVVNVLLSVKPDVVINCVGIIKQLTASNDPLITVPLNSLFPHMLAKYCGSINARFIHISTDCVFSGNKGMYKESDIPDANDLYGRSKYLGEVGNSNTITLRTSIIGHELNSCYGLVEWFLSQKQAVNGYTRAIFSGFPTVEVAKIIHHHVIPNTKLHGLFHVSSDPINKYELLKLVGNEYNKNTEIIPDDSVMIDRSLDSSHFREQTGFKPSTWRDMISSMRIFG